MSAVGFGLFLVIFYAGLISGLLNDAKNQLDNGGLGHIEVFPKRYRLKHAVGETMPDPSTWSSTLALPEGSETGARVLVRGLATSARGSESVEILGVEWDNERRLSAHLRDVRAGALPSSDDLRGIVVGRPLAARLKLSVGSKVRLMAQRADGEIGADLFRVRGVFHSIAPSIGKRQVFISKEAARELTGLDAVSHQYVIQLPEPNSADRLAANLQSALGENFEVKSWGELLPVLRRMEGLTDSVVLGVSVFVYLLVGLGILNTMLMSVLERTREFGVLMALGTRPGRIVSLVLAESFWIATLSVLVGGALGAAVTWHFSREPITLYSNIGESFSMEGFNFSTAFKTRFVASDLIQATLYVYVMALLVGLYPAARIARLEPSEALRRT
jgi:ABC-type lipoprotein release transport system permease subunit